MIDYGLFHYAAPPRCAGAWIQWYMSRNKIKGTGNPLLPHNPTPQQVLKVSAVRHPCTWLLSYYAGLHTKTFVPTVDVFLALPRTSFNEFVHAYLDRLPGAIGGMFASYNADNILRVEDLPWAANSLLGTLGLAPASVKPIGRLGAALTLPTWDKRLYGLVTEAEKELIERYDY